jgi:hypothetical protein
MESYMENKIILKQCCITVFQYTFMQLEYIHLHVKMYILFI